MPHVVVYDANVFYPNALRDLCIRVAGEDLFQARWTRQIVDEAMGALGKNRPDISHAKLERLTDLINDSVPDCLVTGYEPLIEGLKLPDLKDRHVLAAAIKANAQVIVTANLKDFPPRNLEQWNVEAKSPDAFMLDLIGIDDRKVFSCVEQIAISRKRRPQTYMDILTQLELSGLVQSVAALRSG